MSDLGGSRPDGSLRPVNNKEGNWPIANSDWWVRQDLLGKWRWWCFRKELITPMSYGGYNSEALAIRAIERRVEAWNKDYCHEKT